MLANDPRALPLLVAIEVVSPPEATSDLGRCC